MPPPAGHISCADGTGNHARERRRPWGARRSRPAGGGPREDKGLKPNALGYLSNLVIAIASTAPAYSLAATLGFIVAVGGIGVHAPAVLIVSFIPMLFISVGYCFMNLADPDAARRSRG